MEVGEKLFSRAYSSKNAFHSSIRFDMGNAMGMNVFLQFEAVEKFLDIHNIVIKIYNDTRRGTIIELYDDNTTKVLVISSVSPQTQTKIKQQIEAQCKK